MYVYEYYRNPNLKLFLKIKLTPEDEHISYPK